MASLATPNFYGNMSNALKDILNMHYFKNSSAASNEEVKENRHENAISQILKKHGFTIRRKDLVGDGIGISVGLWKKPKDWLSDVRMCPLDVGEYAEQPCGTQSSPDFIIRLSDTEVLALEAKSAKDPTPQYNSGGIKPDYLYVFTCSMYNQTTVYWGRDIITPEQQKVIDELIAQQKKLEQEANIKLSELDKNHRGISYYTRPMITQSGGKEKTSYFRHIHRNECERKVIEYFTSKV